MEDDPELAAIRARLVHDLAVRAPPASAAEVLEATDASLPGLLQAHRLLLLDCSAAWCGPCQMMEPVVERLARELAGEAAVAKLDIDANPLAARALGVMSVPTFVVFKDGRPVDRLMGAMPGERLKAAVRRHARVGGVGPRR